MIVFFFVYIVFKVLVEKVVWDFMVEKKFYFDFVCINFCYIWGIYNQYVFLLVVMNFINLDFFKLMDGDNEELLRLIMLWMIDIDEVV